MLFSYVLLFQLWGMVFTEKKKKWNSFNCIYWYVTYYVLLCRIWSDVLWSLLVTWFYSESFQIMTKEESGHKKTFILFVWDMLSLARCTKYKKFKEERALKWLGRRMYKFMTCWPVICGLQSYEANLGKIYIYVLYAYIYCLPEWYFDWYLIILIQKIMQCGKTGNL